MPPADRHYRFFVSSTYNDLKNERQAVLQTVLEMGHMPAGMELFAATAEHKWQLIRGEIDNSDFLITLIKSDYGSRDPGTGKSYTEMEYDYAVSIGVPVIAFVAKDRPGTPPDDVADLDAFRTKVETRNAPRFESIDDLQKRAAAAIHRNLKDTDRPGWIRGNVAPDARVSRGESQAGVVPFVPPTTNFSPQTFATPQFQGEWLLARGVVAVDIAAVDRIPSAVWQQLRELAGKAVSHAACNEWLDRWGIESSAEVDAVWQRASPFDGSYATFRRSGVLLPRGAPFVDARCQLGQSQSAVGPRGLWVFVDLATSTQVIAEHQDVVTNGAIRNTTRGRRLGLEDVAMTGVNAMKTCQSVMTTTLDVLGPTASPQEWRWGLHLWASRELNNFVAFPPKLAPEPNETNLANWLDLSTLAPVSTSDPDLDVVVETWINETLVAMGRR